MPKALSFLFCLFCIPSVLAQHKVIFINPGYADTNTTGPFWFEVSELMRDAADDLDIDLTIEYANRNHILMKSLVVEAIDTKPDMLILVDEKSVLSQLLLDLPKFDTPIYFLLNRPTDDELAALSSKGLNMSGSVVPNNVQAGKLLAQKLVEKNNGQANIYAIHGDYTTHASIDRQQGITDYISKTNNAKLVAQSVANWSATQAYRQSIGFLNHQKQINIIWSANDAIALGAISALNDNKIRDKVLVGAINWPLKAASEKIDICIGGHVTLGALAMVNIYDIFQQQPLELHQSIAIFTPHTAKTVTFVEQIHSNSLAIDFKKFSKTEQNSEPFSIAALLP